MRAVWARRMVGLCIVTSFIPYPALALGRATGLQASEALALGAFFALPPDRRAGRHLRFYSVWCLCVLASLVLQQVVGGLLDTSRALHAAVAEPLALSPLLVGGALADYGLERFLRYAAVGVIANSVVGGIQFYEFSHHRFPFLSLYRNPSFASVRDKADLIVLYIQRPFGLFPEPSAMSAAIGPWLVMFFGAIRRGVGGFLVKAAFLSGTLLVIASRSGFALVIGGVLIGLYVWDRAPSRSVQLVPRLRFLPFAVVPGAALALYLFVTRIGRAFTVSAENVSYSTRATSIADATAQVMESPLRVLIGVGPGQAYLHFQNDVANGVIRVAQTASTVGIDSVVLRFVAENGLLLGGGVLIFGGVRALAALRGPRWLWGGAVALVAGAGLTFATSYESLSPIWLAVTVVLNWDAVTRRSERCWSGPST